MFPKQGSAEDPRQLIMNVIVCLFTGLAYNQLPYFLNYYFDQYFLVYENVSVGEYLMPFKDFFVKPML